MMQWIIVAIIIALCVLYICRRLLRRPKDGSSPCSGCSDCCNCPHRPRRK